VIAIHCQEPGDSTNRVNTSIPRILLLSSLLLFSGCASGRILYWFDPPYWSTLGGDIILQARLDGFALAHGKLPTFVLTRPGPDPHGAITKALSTGRFGTVVVGPLLSLDSQQLALNHPRVRFILVHAAPTVAATTKNVTVLSFDRRDAFRRAGTVAALVAAEQPSVGTQASSSVCILTNEGSDLSSAELDAFRDGASSTSPPGAPVTHVITGSSDSTAVQAAVAALRKSGVQVFLLSLGVANPIALDALKSAGGIAVVADWARAGLDAAQVLLSVETEETDGLMSAIAAKDGGLVNGKVRLVLGDARPIPAAARPLLDAQR